MSLAKYLFVSFCIVVFAFSCSQKVEQQIKINPKYADYVSGFTSGSISKEAPIRIVLAKDIENGIELDSELADLVTLSPSVAGVSRVLSKREIVFTPSVPLTSGTRYTVSVNLEQLMKVEDGLPEVFEFQFNTIDQSAHTYIDGLSTYSDDDLKDQKLEGRILTSDVIDTLLLKKGVHAFQEGKELNIYWNFSRPNEHRFTVQHVARKKAASKVEIEVNLVGAGVNVTDKKTVEVLALGDFKSTDMEVIHEPEQYVNIHFSDPLKASQDLTGLIKIDNVSGLRFQIERHDVKVFLPYRISGTRNVKIEPGIKNVNGFKMKLGAEIELVFEGIKPNVKLSGDGTIIPNSGDGYALPFEAVNLNAVDVYVTKVYQTNMLQFLQVNNIGGSYNLKRVAKTIFKKSVRLDKDASVNLHKSNLFFLDLKDIIEDEPGTIYQVEIKFKKSYSVYRCAGQDDDDLASMDDELEASEDTWSEDNWESDGYYDDYYYYDYYDEDYESYDYRERDNPCHASYYRGKGITSNVLASDIGIIAKAGSDHKVHVFLSDINTTDNMSGVNVEFYDYQQQLIGSSTSDSEGMVTVDLPSKPFVLIAKKGTQRGYLRMRDGEALSMSKFDVSGARLQKGVKGFVYTERGVWRPGDSIFVSFMIEDRNKILPANHPVKLKLYNPQGQLVDKQIARNGMNGLYSFVTKTDQDDVTGNYRAEVSVGNRTFNKYLKIETVKPNRLKVYMDFKEDVLTEDADNKIKLSSKWLHGAIAKNLRAKVNLTMRSSYTAFDKFKGYSFDDPLKKFESNQETILDDRLDENGVIEFNPELSIGNSAPGMLMANFETKIFEDGGNFSVDWKSIKYSPYSAYAGVKVPTGDLYRGTLVTDQEHTFKVASVTPQGKAQSGKKLDVKIYKVEWRYWWDGYNNDVLSYISRESSVPVFHKTLTTGSTGEAKFNFEVKRPTWGRYIVRVEDPESGHVSGKIFYVDWPYWARSNRTENENATMLSFSTDKPTYAIGEKVKLSFPSPSNGKALITVESGTKVVEKYWVKTTKGETKFEFDANKEMAPNVFVHVSLLQPHAETKNDLPLRMYGVVPITVENPDSHLNPVISMKDVLRPESTASIKVSESEGKPMTYTLAIVDEGLLDLTAFKTPKPWDHFYAKEALGVRTWDMYDDVMNAYNMEMNKLLSIGGDADGGEKKPAKANRFKPMVKFIGPFELPKGGDKTHQIKLPNYVGSVRVMVVAEQDLRYGSAEKTVPVRSPLMVLGTLPRVLGPGEEVQLPVNVFAMEKKIKNVTITVESNDLLKLTDGSTKKITFSKIGDQVVNFPIKVSDKLGIGKINIKVKSGNETARFEIELDVRTPNPMAYDVQEAVIEPGKSWNPSFKFQGIEGSNAATIEVSSIPPINMDRRMKYLFTYPHGCVEQTTSAAFPQLFIDDVMELDNNVKIEIDKNVKAAIKRLSLFQTSEGGLAYWPGNTNVNQWGTNYAMHFLMEAEKQGYSVPRTLKDNLIRYQRREARNWKDYSKNGWDSRSNQLTQSYRLYILALAKSPELGAMNRMKENSSLTSQAKWRLAGAYALNGRSDVANELIAKETTTIADYRELSYTYGSSARDEAMILEVLTLLDDKSKGGLLAKKVAERLNSSRWMSTQTTAYSLISMSKFAGSGATNKTMRFTYSQSGGKLINQSTQKPVYTNELKVKSGNQSLSFDNKGKGMLYVKVVTEGIPVSGDTSTSASHCVMSVSYTNLAGEEIDPTSLEQGTDFIAEVNIYNPGSKGYLREMTLNQIFPSGWEIHNTRMQTFASAVATSNFEYQDVRDDRVYTYFSLAKSKSKTFRVQLNATYLGKYYLPTVATEAMYDNTINARQPGKWVEVVKSRK